MDSNEGDPQQTGAGAIAQDETGAESPLDYDSELEEEIASSQQSQASGGRELRNKNRVKYKLLHTGGPAGGKKTNPKKKDQKTKEEETNESDTEKEEEKNNENEENDEQKLQERIKELEEENQKLKQNQDDNQQKIDKQEKDLTKTKTEKKQLQAKITKLEEENREKTTKLDEAIATNSDLQSKILEDELEKENTTEEWEKKIKKRKKRLKS